jgi:Uma2 family endonuclease
MAETATDRYHTADMVRDLMERAPLHWPRYETVYGELLVSSSPGAWHQEVVGRLFVALRAYLAREPGARGHAFMAPADISWGRRDVLVQPDLFVTPLDEARALDWRRVTRLLLGVEVVSPGSRRADHFTKRRLYQAQGTPLYWVIDGERRTADAWTPDDDAPRAVGEALVWHPAGAAEAVTLALGELFRPL